MLYELEIDKIAQYGHPSASIKTFILKTIIRIARQAKISQNTAHHPSTVAIFPTLPFMAP